MGYTSSTDGVGASTGKPKWTTTAGNMIKNAAGSLSSSNSTWDDIKDMAGRALSNAQSGSYAGSGSGGGGGTGSSGYIGGGGDNYFDASSVYMDYLNRLQAQAEASYERNMERIANAYNSSRQSLTDNYNSTRGQLDASRAKSANEINSDSEAAMRQAYINNMLSRRDLQQALTAQGMSGGASETTRASLENNYGNARNQIDTTRGKNLSDLEEVYNNNLAQARQAYNSNMANLDMQRMQLEQQAENALNNFEAGYAANFSMLAPSNEAYLNALAALTNNQNNFTYQGAVANNPYIAASMQQAQNGTNTNYAEYLAQQALMNGGSAAGVKSSLYNQYRNGQISQEDLVSMLNRLGI